VYGRTPLRIGGYLNVILFIGRTRAVLPLPDGRSDLRLKTDRGWLLVDFRDGTKSIADAQRVEHTVTALGASFANSRAASLFDDGAFGQCHLDDGLTKNFGINS
jgi:hypothetical protein